MDYLEIVKEFLKEFPNYKNDISNFNKFLELKWKHTLSDDMIQIFIQGLDVDFIVESLDYHVKETKTYTKRTSARRYATVVGCFFDFIRKHTTIKNKELFDAVSYGRNRENAYMKRMMAYINQSEVLEGIAEVEILSHSEVEKILDWTGAQFEKGIDWNDVSNFRKAMAALGIKLILMYGITYRELRKLKWEQYDEILGILKIGGFELRLPMRLSFEMQLMKKFLEDSNKMQEEGILLVDYDGTAWGEITSSSHIPDYLGTLIENTSITSMVKYGISELIMAGLSDAVIKRITGASDKLIAGCMGQWGRNMNDAINNRLVTVDFYYRF